MSRSISARAVSVRAENIRIVRLPLGEEAIRPTFRPERGAINSGDASLASIAAATMVAQVTRDRLLTRLGLLYPGYGFEHHKGYSVPAHFEALTWLGPTIPHRPSFAPVAAAYGDVVTDDMERGEIEPGTLPL